MAVEDTVEESTLFLQSAIDKVCNWTKEWGIQLNNSKYLFQIFKHKYHASKYIYRSHRSATLKYSQVSGDDARCQT